MNDIPKHPTPAGQEQLERWAARLLSEQPPRRAPDSLEQRVMAQVRQRAQRPWWQCSFWDWPLAARLVLLCASIVSGLLGLRVMNWLLSPIESVSLTEKLPHSVSWMETLFNAAAAVMHYLPPLWIYGALAILGVMYATLFGLGAAAYRTLYIGAEPSFR